MKCDKICFAWTKWNSKTEQTLLHLLGFLGFIVHRGFSPPLYWSCSGSAESWSWSHSSWMYFFLFQFVCCCLCVCPSVVLSIVPSLPLSVRVILASVSAASFLFFLFLQWLFFWGLSWGHTHEKRTGSRGSPLPVREETPPETDKAHSLCTDTHTYTKLTFN